MKGKASGTLLAGLSVTTLLASLAAAQPVSMDLGNIAVPGTLGDTFTLASGQIKWYKFTLTAPITDASNFFDMGTLSNAGTAVNTDTEIGLYRADGTFVATDDDSGPDQYSELSFGMGCPARPSTQPPLGAGLNLAGQNGPTLPAGTYYLAVAGFNATFNPTGWSVTTTSTITGAVQVFLTTNTATDASPANLTGATISQASVRPGQTVLITGTLNVCGATGATVTLDASALGDGAAINKFDDGTNGDTLAGNRIYSLAYTIPAAAAAGAYTLNINASNANGASAPRPLAVTVVSPTTLTPAAGVYTETEDNNTKGGANNIAVFASGESITGSTTGTSTTVAGIASADYYRIKAAAAPLGIYSHTLTLTSPTLPTSYACTLRGRTQTNGVSQHDDATFLTAATANQMVKWFGFGKQEEVLYRVTGATTTTAPYTSAHTVTPVTPIVLGSTLFTGSITIDRDPANTTLVDMIVFDNNLNPVPGYLNQGNNSLTRNFPVGQYYLAVSNANTANDQVSAFDDLTRTGALMDFPNAVANSSTTTVANMNMRFTDVTASPTAAAGSKSAAFDVVWYQFTVVPLNVPTNPHGTGAASPSTVQITGSTLLTVAVTGGLNPPSTVLAVQADLSSINGSSTQTFYDDGTHGDVTAGDNTFSFSVVMAEPQSAGPRTLPFTVSDAQSRSSNGSISLTATAAPVGRCCTGSTCSIVSAFNCGGGGGIYGGNGTDCGTVTYTFSDSATPYATISGTGTLSPTATNVDDGGDTIPLPFNFNFFGNNYTSVWICSNGFLQFGGTNSTTFTNDTIPSTAVPNNAIYPLWDDYNTISTVDAGAGDVYYQVGGVSPNRTFTVDWSHVTEYRLGAPATYPQTDENFQVILYEGSNNIEFRYGALRGACNTNVGQCTGIGGDGDDRTVGVENSTGTAAFSIPGASIGTGGISKMVTYVAGTPCAPSTGSCCTNSTCTITTAAACGGTWTAGGVCTGPGSCPPACGSADFNCDGDVGTDSDISGFFACLSGACPPLPCISNADFNGDGDTGTDGDIEAFFRVLGGGHC